MAAKNDKQKKKDSEDIKIDFGMGNISLGGLFQGIANVMDLVSKMEEEGKEEIQREGKFTSPSGKVNAVYGFTLKTGISGKPTVEPFGNVKKTARGPVVEEERQPLVDIFDEKDHILVIIELPGIEKGDIQTAVKGDILTISAARGDRKYYKEVVLPAEVDAERLTSKYKNGVLEMRIGKM